jgi:hypothetical protein
MQVISFNEEFVKKNWEGALAYYLVTFYRESGIHGLKSGRQRLRPYHERSKTGLPASRGVIKYPMNNCVISSLV